MATIRAKKVFKKVLKGSSISQAMREEGYALTTASTTGKLTNTQGWQELLNKYIPDKDLARVHKEGLSARFKGNPDFSTRHKYLETGYKIKGKMKEAEDPTSQIPHVTLIQINTPDGSSTKIGVQS